MNQVEAALAEKFLCAKCHSNGAEVQTLTMTGAGLSRFLDLQRHQYMFASCRNCGYTEVYSKRKSGALMNALDVLFGG